MPFVSGHSRAKWVQAFLVFLILLNVVLLIPAYAFATNPNYIEVTHPLDFVLWVYGIAYLITVILFLMWVHRSHKNLKALGADETKFSPRSAVLWWFVPFMNLFKPEQVVKEIWEWSVSPDTKLVTVWWWLFVFTFIAIPFIDSTSWGPLVTTLVEIAAAILAIRVVQGIDVGQERKASEALPALY